MALVVPINKNRPQAQAPGPTVPAAPDPNYLLMAAAQMHSEGRLMQPGTKPNG